MGRRGIVLVVTWPNQSASFNSPLSSTCCGLDAPGMGMAPLQITQFSATCAGVFWLAAATSSKTSSSVRMPPFGMVPAVFGNAKGLLGDCVGGDGA